MASLSILAAHVPATGMLLHSNGDMTVQCWRGWRVLGSRSLGRKCVQYSFVLGLQLNYDLWHAEHREQPVVDRLVAA